MRSSLIDDSIRYEFRYILNILIHFSFSLTQLVSILAILGLQISLTITGTCAYRIGIGFWAFPFLIICPLSIWLVIWQRNSSSCLIAICAHFSAALFATAIIIVSFLALVGPFGITCSSSSLNSSFAALNGSMIVMSGLFKLFNYGEVMLLFTLLRNKNSVSTSSTDEYFQLDYSSGSDRSRIGGWHSWSAITNDNHHSPDVFFL